MEVQKCPDCNSKLHVIGMEDDCIKTQCSKCKENYIVEPDINLGMQGLELPAAQYIELLIAEGSKKESL